MSALCFQREKEEDQKRLHSRRKKKEEEHQRLWSPKILLQSVTPSRVPPTPSIATAPEEKIPPFSGRIVVMIEVRLLPSERRRGQVVVL